MVDMTDTVARLLDAEADVDWLLVERDRLIGENEQLRAGLLRCVQYDNKCDQTGVPCREPGRCSCYLEAGTWLE